MQVLTENIVVYLYLTDLVYERGPHRTGKNQGNSKINLWTPDRWGHKSKRWILFGSKDKRGSSWSKEARRRRRWLVLFTNLSEKNLSALLVLVNIRNNCNISSVYKYNIYIYNFFSLLDTNRNARYEYEYTNRYEYEY